MKDGLKVEYDNENQVYLIPNPRIDVEHFVKISLIYSELGYKWWLPADERGGYILSKISKKDKLEMENEKINVNYGDDDMLRTTSD